MRTKSFVKLVGIVPPKTFFDLCHGFPHGGAGPGTSFPEFGSSKLRHTGIEVLVIDLGPLSQVL
jgi:hypothetical protein